MNCHRLMANAKTEAIATMHCSIDILCPHLIAPLQLPLQHHLKELPGLLRRGSLTFPRAVHSVRELDQIDQL